MENSFLTTIPTDFFVFGISCLVALAVIRVYMSIAFRLKIIDKPNERSSHTTPIILGGGVVFPIVLVFGSFFLHLRDNWFILGLFLVSSISFIDDRRPLPTWLRLGFHLGGVTAMLYGLGFWNEGWIFMIAAYVLVIGWLNAFNFMDGINGITALYALSMSGTALLIYNQYGRDLRLYNDVHQLLILGISALLAFAFFNVRKRARCFAGDVGSVSMGLFLAFIMLPIVINISWAFVGLAMVYGIDAIFTIISRIIRKENIFEAHRTHLYQYLANEMKWGHLKVSFTYFAVQLLINAILIWGYEVQIHQGVLFFSTAIPVSIFYLAIRKKVVNTIRAVDR